jgi:hypothetical protein
MDRQMANQIGAPKLQIMPRTLSLAWMLAVLVAGVTPTAHAEDAKGEIAPVTKEDEAFQQRLFGHALAGKTLHACFTRTYDTAHLAQHPQQNVRTMQLLVRANADADQPRYELSLGVTFRKSGAHFESAGDCGSIHDTSEVGGASGTAHCGVDCDGGQLDVAMKEAKSVQVSIPAGVRIWRAGSDNDRDQSRRFGADDKVFRLDKAALTDCLNLANDADEKAVMRRGQ